MSLTAKAKQLLRIESDARGVSLPDDIRELTGYKPRPLQAQLRRAEKRFNVEVMHRRFGKTVEKVNKLIERAVECPFRAGRYAYIAPTYTMAEDIAWTYLKEFGLRIPGAAPEEGKLSLWVPQRNGSRARIRLYGVDSPKQRLRGLYLDGAVFDEYAHIPPHVFALQVRPMLTDNERAGIDQCGDRNQWADFIFTPFGRNHAHRMYHDADLWSKGMPVMVGPAGDQKPLFRDDWFAALMKASETGILGRKELEDALHDMGQAEYDQEYECSFDATVKGAVYGKEIAELRRTGRVTAVPIAPGFPVSTAWDLGFGDAMAIWFFQVIGKEVRIVDYYENSGFGFDHYADELEKKNYRYGRHLFPHDVTHGELGTGKSRASVLNSMGIRVTAVPRHNVDDGISAARALLGRCWFDATRCADGMDRLALYRYGFDEKNQTSKKAPVHDWTSHGADAFRILAEGVRDLNFSEAHQLSQGEF